MGKIVIDNNGIWVDESIATISYPEEANEIIFSVEDTSFWFQHRNNILKIIMERFPFKDNFADIGGGNGFQAKFIATNFAKADIFLIEPGYFGCLNAKNRGIKNVYNQTFQQFEFLPNNINGVGLFDVIEHIENDVDFILELKAKLPTNSYIYITVPAHKKLWSDVDDYGGHFRRYNIKMLEDLAKQSNVKIVYASYFFSYVPFITYFIKTLPYKWGSKRNDQDILTSESERLAPSGIILKVFDIFHRYELSKIEKLSMKFGGSCIAVFKT